MRLEIGKRVNYADGVYGELADIVIDPLEKRVMHLVVQLEQGEGEARLVPIQLVKGTDSEQAEIELECTLDKAQGFESVRESAYLRLGEPRRGRRLGGRRRGRPRAAVLRGFRRRCPVFRARLQRDPVLRPRTEGRGRGAAGQRRHLCGNTADV